jgi:hypothetical protein
MIRLPHWTLGARPGATALHVGATPMSRLTHSTLGALPPGGEGLGDATGTSARQ